MNILVFGKNGMLGSMLYSFLRHKNMEVYGTQRTNQEKPFYFNIAERYSDTGFLENILTGIDFVVNCVGITRLNRDSLKDFCLDFYINATFPALLQQCCFKNSIKMVHISTDAVFKGSDQPSYEGDMCDGTGDYAVSKILGEIDAPNVLNIRCSLVGHEMNSNENLLEWFLSQKNGNIIQGYTNNVWNGVTTLQLSEFIYKLFTKNLYDNILKETRILHFSPNIPLSKFALLNIFKRVYAKDLKINPSSSQVAVTRILDSKFKYFYLEEDRRKNIDKEIEAMKHFYDNNIKGVEK